MAQSVEIVGLPRLQASLDGLSRELAAIAPPDAARIIGQTARSRAPHRTGRLAASFRADTSPGVLGLGFGTAYAAPVHWGTGPRQGLRGPHNIRPSLFLTSAINDLEKVWMGPYSDAAQKACDRVKGA